MKKQDSIILNNGEKMEIIFLGHASLGFRYRDYVLYIDPVRFFADYAQMPQADVILVTHHHDDHLDKDLIGNLSKMGTRFISTRTVVDAMGRGEVMNNGDATIIDDLMGIQAIPAYNTTAGREVFHPQGGRDNGYLLTIGGTRIYLAGDGEPTPEMLALKDIDIAFLHVNQPYTMTVQQAVDTVKTLKPKIFYPIHCGQSDQKTDLGDLTARLEGSGIDVRIRPME